MSITLVRKSQIRPLNIIRSDINTTTSGSALITKVIAGTGLTLSSSTGINPGTGDVTIALSIASASVIGGVKIGSGLSIAVDGTISVITVPVTWGSITGTLSSQTDLQAALNAKYNNPTGTTSQYIDGTGAYRAFPTFLSSNQLSHEVKAGVAINKGQAVYVTSADGTNMIVGLASNASEATSSKTMGLLDSTVSTNGFARVITEGLLAGLNTNGANAGDPVWLGTGGNLIYGLVNKPSAPAHLVFIGIVTRANSNNGEIFVKVQNGFEMGELHDYVQNGVQDNYVISYESSTSLYKPKSIATLLGYTPANDASVVHTSGNETIAGIKTFSSTTQSTSTSTGAVVIGGGLGVAKNLYVGGDLNIAGNLTIGGTTTTVNAQNLSVSDNMIYLNNGIQTTITNAAGNGTSVIYTTQEVHNYSIGMVVTITGVSPSVYNLTNQTITAISSNSFTVASGVVGGYVSGGTARAKSAANPDLGFAGGYNDGSYAHAGLFRDASDNVWKFFKGYTPEPDASPYIDTAHASFAYADLRAYNITGNSFVKVGGTSSQFLKADGSVDTATYLTSYTETDTLASVTARGASTSTGVAFNGGATASTLRLNGAPIASEASLSLGAHGTDEGGQLVLNKATSYSYAAHIDVWHDVLRFLYGSNTATTGVAMSLNLSNRQLVLNAYTAVNSFTGTAVGYLAFDSSGNVITVASPAGAVTSVNAGTGVSVNSTTGAVTVSIGQSVATSATPSFDKVFLTNNGSGTNLKVGDDVWIGDVNNANTLGVVGQQDNNAGYIAFGSDWTTTLGRTGSADLTWGGNRIWTAANLTNLNQLTNGPGYITGITSANVTTALGYTPYNSTNPSGYITSASLSGYATQSWVQSQGYLTSVSDVWVNNSGDSMSGNLAFGASGAGITWAANTDGASITFESTGDGGNGTRAYSNLLIALSDNGDEGLKVTSSSTELFYVNTNIIQYKGNNLATQAWVNAQGFLTSVSDVWVNTTGDTMTGTLQINGGWATTYLTGDNVILRKPNYSSGGWARNLLDFQEYNGTSLFQIGGYGSNNTLSYGYLGSAYNNPTMRWYADKRVIFSGDISSELSITATTNLYLGNTLTALTKGSGDSLRITTGTGSVDIGSMNGGWVHFQADRAVYMWANGSAFTFDADVIPYNTNVKSLGSSDYRWARVYANGGDSSQWNAAYSWGNHASAGYITSLSDTLATVTARGASTGSAVTLSSGANHFNGHHYFDAYDNNGNHYPHYNPGSSNNGSKLNLRMFDSGGSVILFYLNGATQEISWGGNAIWHAGNDGAGSGLDADKLDGYQPSSTGGGNYIAQYASNGYLYVNNWIHPANGTGLFYDSGPHFYESGGEMYSSHALRVNGRLYLNDVESANLYGIRGRFTNEYIHLYNKVGVGSPNGWGQGETNTPNYGLSTYGGINIAYGSDNGATINTYTRINKNWGGGDFGGEAFTIYGNNASLALRSVNSNSKWLFHMDTPGDLRFYEGGTVSNNSWTNYITFYRTGKIGASGGDSDQWNSAYSWGNHAGAGYWNVNNPDPVVILSNDVRFEAHTAIFVNNLEVQGQFFETSSLRYKENVINLETVTEKVNKLRPVRYNKIGNTEQEIGLIAEEVSELFPEFVNYNEAGQPDSLNYTRLSVVLLQTIKELSDKINKLETK